MVPDIQNKGNVCEGVCACVCVIYEDGSGLIKEHIYTYHQNQTMILGTLNAVLVVKITFEDLCRGHTFV